MSLTRPVSITIRADATREQVAESAYQKGYALGYQACLRELAAVMPEFVAKVERAERSKVPELRVAEAIAAAITQTSKTSVRRVVRDDRGQITEIREGFG